MQTAFDTTVRIDHPPEEVWRAVTDWERVHEWMPGIEAAVGPSDLEPGAELRLRTTRGERISTITVCEPPRVLVVRSSTGPITAEYRYELAPATPGETDARIVGRCSVGGVMRPLAPLIRRTLRRTDAEQLTTLRDVMRS